MTSKTPVQQMRYNERLKFQLDQAARMERAIREGKMKGPAEGRREGVLLAAIQFLQNLLGITEPTQEELANWDEARLSELAEQLQQQLRSRGQ